MKRLHVHIAVEDLEASINFYTTLFDQRPGVVKHDYANWMLDDPRVNFAISDRHPETGLDHLGIQVDTADELAELAYRTMNNRITLFINLPMASLDRLSLQRRLDQIGERLVAAADPRA